MLDARDLATRATLDAPHTDAVRSLVWLEAPTVDTAGTLLSGGWDKRLVRTAVKPSMPANLKVCHEKPEAATGN